jgi:hypothetical protein
LQNAAARLDRALRYVCPFLFLIVALNLLYGMVHGPQWMWNEVRLAPGFSLAYGYHLYPGEHALAPIAGTLYSPVGHLLYAGLSFLRDPTAAIVAACALSMALYFAPLWWVHLRAAGESRLIGVYGFLACAALVLASPGTNYSALNVHVDASAVCASVLAAGIVATGRAPLSRRALAVSAALAVLSVACKQTMAPVPVALAAFLLLADGPKTFVRYLVFELAAGVAVGGAILLLFRPPRDLWFNVYWLATHRPTVGGLPRVLEGLAAERLSLGAVVPPLVVLAAIVWISGSGGARAILAGNRWLVFLLAALFQAPFALKAWVTAGGDYNHLGAVTLFVTLAATVGLIMVRGSAMFGLVQRALLVGIVVATLPFPWNLRHALATIRDNPSEAAFRYEESHPGRAYFPFNPLVPLLASGHLTHFDVSLTERADAGCPITPAQFAAGLPPHFELVAWPSTYPPPGSPSVIHLLRSMRRVHEPGLEGWHVFARTDPAKD